MIRRTSLLALVAALSLSSPVPQALADTDPTALVDALQGVFGTHDGFRRGHANGICIKGSFKASAEASGLTTAKHLAKDATSDVIGRFSMGGGTRTHRTRKRTTRAGLRCISISVTARRRTSS